jgi:hypothetical protein
VLDQRFTDKIFQVHTVYPASENGWRVIRFSPINPGFFSIKWPEWIGAKTVKVYVKVLRYSSREWSILVDQKDSRT